MTENAIITEVLARSGKTTTSGWISDTQLDLWASQAHRWAAARHKWPFTEGRTFTTYTTANEVWDFEGYKADSFRIIRIGAKRLQKLNFEDYQIAQEESPSNNDRMFSDFGNLVYVNTNIDLSGTMVAYGQYMPANFDSTDLTEETVFSEGNDEGNQAIVEEIIGYIFARDRDKTGAINQHEKAINILDELWKRILAEQHAYQTHPDRGGMFRRFNVIDGGHSDEVKRNQF